MPRKQILWTQNLKENQEETGRIRVVEDIRYQVYLMSSDYWNGEQLSYRIKYSTDRTCY